MLSIQLDDEIEYRCLRFECTHCGIEVADGITTEMIYGRHGHHLEMVTVEVEIIATGEIWVLQPVPLHGC